MTTSVRLRKSAEVKTVGSAEEALSEIGAHHYDLCFLDYMLPGMNGLEAMIIINKRSAHTKVAIMTGKLQITSSGKNRESCRYILPLQ